MSLGYRPLVYMWIAEFSDGSALPQFDPETGKENKADPDWLPSAEGQPPIPKPEIFKKKKLVRIGWYPFTSDLSGKLLNSSEKSLVTIPTYNPSFSIELKNEDRPICYRTNSIKFSLRGGVRRGETVYVLGKVGGKVLRIREDGSVEA